MVDKIDPEALKGENGEKSPSPTGRARVNKVYTYVLLLIPEHLFAHLFEQMSKLKCVTSWRILGDGYDV